MPRKPRREPTRLDLIRKVMGPWGDEQPKDERDYWAMMNHFSDWITENYGYRCPDVGGGCPTCGAWAVYDLARATFMEPE